MRSLIAPRVKHEGPVTLQGPDGEAVVEGRAVNLSTGGMLVEAAQPFEPGARLAVTVSLGDERDAMTLTGEVVRVDARDPADGDGATAVALKFVEVDDGAQVRLQQFIDAAPKEPTSTFAREVRIRLPMWPAPIRATARAHTEDGLLLEADLPWLHIGGAVAAEVAPGEHQAGVVSWVGLEVADGAPRLSIHVERSADAEAVFAPVDDAPAAELEPTPSGSVDIPVDDLRPPVDRDAPTELLVLSDTVPVADSDIEADVPASPRRTWPSIVRRAALALSVGAMLVGGGWVAGARTHVAPQPQLLQLDPIPAPPPSLPAPIVLRIPVAPPPVAEPVAAPVIVRRPTAPAPKRRPLPPAKPPARR